jgi:hypothetical protein
MAIGSTGIIRNDLFYSATLHDLQTLQHAWGRILGILCTHFLEMSTNLRKNVPNVLLIEF